MMGRTQSFPHILSVNNPIKSQVEDMVGSVRLLYLVFLIGFVAMIQFVNDPYVDPSYSIGAFAVVSISFLLQAAVFFLPLSKRKTANIALCFFEAIAITALIHITQFSQPIFLILYLVNIGLMSIENDLDGAILVALFTSLCFNSLAAFTDTLVGQELYIALIANNVAFAGAAALGGYLSQHISSLSHEVHLQKMDLSNLQALNELIVGNVANAMIATDLNGEITFTNQAAEKVFSLKSKQLKTLRELFFSSYSEVERLMQSSNEKRSLRTEIHLQQDGNRTFEVILSRLNDSKNAPRGFLLLLQDLTEMKALERKLREKEKLAAVGQLAAGIAHEIRNPLASISGSLQFMAEGEKDLSSDGLKLMRISLKEIDRLNDLISEFMEYVKPAEHAADPVDVNQILEEVLDMVKMNPKLRRETEQIVELSSKSGIRGNSAKLKQAFLNIIINAYQAMDPIDNPKIEVQTYEQENYLYVTISDKGNGIPEESLSRIFEPFHTTKSNGTGLGLAITYKILETHQASVNVESTVGEGTRFVMAFPLDNQPLGREQKQFSVA